MNHEVIDQEMHDEVGRHCRLDCVEELTEFESAMAGVAFAEDRPVAMLKAAKREVVPWRF